jgi:hypothetical protein
MRGIANITKKKNRKNTYFGLNQNIALNFLGTCLGRHLDDFLPYEYKVN